MTKSDVGVRMLPSPRLPNESDEWSSEDDDDHDIFAEWKATLDSMTKDVEDDDIITISPATFLLK